LRHGTAVHLGLLACTALSLCWLAWRALSGGIRQLSRTCTLGQKIETAVQLESGLLSLLVLLSSLRRSRWAQPIRHIWSMTLVVTAGLSALVWGPPMPHVGALFAALALLASQAITWALRTTVEY
jgi:hypothetical protein